MHQKLYELSKEKAIHTIWFISDLQQYDPILAKQFLTTAMTDYQLLGNPADLICYLGDAVESYNLTYLKEMTDMQVEAFNRLGIPICYVTGNHDYDYANHYPEKAPCMPFYDTIRQKKNWHTTKNCDDFYFKYKLGTYTIFFLADHISPQNKWCVTHGTIRRGNEYYPYTQEDADRLRAEIAATPGPVITASHYAFLGGNRGSELISRLFPLPSNVRIHFYGHAHIGDFNWAKENTYRRIAWTDWHDIPQINVSSLENIRGNACRSVFLHIYDDGGMGIFFRNHDKRIFTESYFPSNENMPHGYHNPS